MRYVLCGLVAVTLAVGGGPATLASQGFVHLDPGGPANFPEKVPITFVFVGYEPAQVGQAAFLRELPALYKPVVRSRLWYGVTELVGLHYTFDYRVVYADAAFEDAFFAALAQFTTPADRTLFQNLYNRQQKNVLEVGQNHFIDAPTVEKWLVEHAPAGVDTTRNTVFFVNWWARPGFKFHVYTKFGEPDPDTGYDFGVNRESRKIIAWGGTTANDEETGLGALGTRRVWFYDLSAGPEAWTDNWNVDDSDVDGDGAADYRMPPIWEYLTPGGYRSASALAGDLGKVARYVAINLLFTSSPLYPPSITPQRLPASINQDLNTYEGWPGTNASELYQKTPLLVSELAEVHRITYNADKQDLAFTGQALDCYVKWLSFTKCYPNLTLYPADANLFLYHALNITKFWDGGAEYEALHFNYATTDDLTSGFLGFADDNWFDGTQSFTHNFVSPSIIDAGYGLTTTQIHEYGHHFGMSHPHDGYDYERGFDYGPEGNLYYAWSGDETNSMMSYIDLNWDYSQFDRDNANRFQAAAYVLNANAIAKDILASPNAALAMADLQIADQEIGKAKTALAAHDYIATFDHARLAYRRVRTGAARAGVKVVASQNGWTVHTAPAGPRQAVKRDYAYKDRFALVQPVPAPPPPVPGSGARTGRQRAKP